MVSEKNAPLSCVLQLFCSHFEMNLVEEAICRELDKKARKEKAKDTQFTPLLLLTLVLLLAFYVCSNRWNIFRVYVGDKKLSETKYSYKKYN